MILLSIRHNTNKMAKLEEYTSPPAGRQNFGAPLAAESGSRGTCRHIPRVSGGVLWRCAPRHMEVMMAKNLRKKDKQSKREVPKRDQSVSGLGSIMPETGKGERPKAL